MITIEFDDTLTGGDFYRIESRAQGRYQAQSASESFAESLVVPTCRPA